MGKVSPHSVPLLKSCTLLIGGLKAKAERDLRYPEQPATPRTQAWSGTEPAWGTLEASAFLPELCVGVRMLPVDVRRTFCAVWSSSSSALSLQELTLYQMC